MAFTMTGILAELTAASEAMQQVVKLATCSRNKPLFHSNASCSTDNAAGIACSLMTYVKEVSYDPFLAGLTAVMAVKY